MEISHQTYQSAYEPFTPNNSEQRLPPPSYRGCWHGVSRGLFPWYRQFYLHEADLLPKEKRFTTRRPSSRTRHRSVRLSSIAEASRLLPPVGVWAVSQSQCGWPTSQSSYPSQPWWAVTPPTSIMGGDPILKRITALLTSPQTRETMRY